MYSCPLGNIADHRFMTVVLSFLILGLPLVTIWTPVAFFKSYWCFIFSLPLARLLIFSQF